MISKDQDKEIIDENNSYSFNTSSVHSQPKRNKFERAHDSLDPKILAKWNHEQKTLRDKLLITFDDFTWNADTELKLVGGVDISFSDDKKYACAILVVLNYPQMKVVYENSEIVELDQPYISGFLAFREVSHLYKLVQKLKKDKPNLIPQCIIVDGNGIIHQNGFGLASHLGVLVDIPTIGCGKTVFYCDGIKKDFVKNNEKSLKKKGDYLVLKGDSGKEWAAALKATDNSTNSIIISVGHKISLRTAVKVATKVCKYRIPHPVNLADAKSRKIIEKADLSDAVRNPMIFLTKDPNVDDGSIITEINEKIIADNTEI